MFFDIKDNWHQEIETFCVLQRLSFFSYKIIYSSGSEVAFVTYVFLGYGHIAWMLKLSSTSCHLIKINICEKFLDYTKKTLGDHLKVMRNYHNTFQNNSMVVNLNITTYDCTIAQFIVKWQNDCFYGATIFGHKVDLFTPLLFKWFITVEKKTEDRELLLYQAEGMLASKSVLLMSASYEEDAKFFVLGNDFYHKKHDDLYVAEKTYWGSPRIYLSKQKFYNHTKIAETLFYNSFKDTNILLMLKPSFGKLLYFDLKVFSQMPTHKNSPRFYVSFLGGNSWLNLFLYLSGKSVTKAVLITPRQHPIF